LKVLTRLSSHDANCSRNRTRPRPGCAGGLGAAATREWLQINRPDAADYEKDLELFRASLEFVGKTR